MESAGLGDDIAKIIESSGIKTLYEASTQFFDLIRGKKDRKEGECTSCQLRQVFLNKILPYNKKMTVIFKQDYKMATQDKVLFAAIKGEKVEVSKGHPIYAILLSLSKGQIIEEVI